MPNVIVTPHIASLTGINSAVNHMYKKYKESQKTKYLKVKLIVKKVINFYQNIFLKYVDINRAILLSQKY